jgi:hypothetical protein
MSPSALTGLSHSHKYLGYLLALLPMIQLLLVLAGARKKGSLARIVGVIAGKGYNIFGGIILLLGFALFFGLGYPMSSVFVWVSVGLWAPIAICSKRIVLPECETVLAGGEASSRMLVGTLVQLLCMVAIVGLMTVKPFSG